MLWWKLTPKAVPELLFSTSHPIFTNSSPFALAGPHPALDFHREGYNIVSGLSVRGTSRPYDFLSAHRTFRSAFARI